ncbi:MULTISPECIES: hypothetical protein [Bacillus cereus group]|uniref:Uncharacterized protein n=1 Tax=Bacillus thuringiensis subsp. konkukian (strain 97-27) TaxID=281309 RepID=Q6HIA5_BACHK|nr:MULTISPECIES: hypothetical protein [Bacillus cereus group]AAT59996.1 hypothetical protein BT9727_2395 [[Bacillus thuringiensis] serovar konkukian str. 97-27]AJI36968.1 hypothetical protein BG06_5364 [Bacillus thuringiensis]
MECKHKWVDMEDGTNDKFCVKCSKKLKQMQIILPISLPISVNAALPMAREKMTINSYGHLHEVYKDEWEAEFYRKRGIGVNSFRNSTK